MKEIDASNIAMASTGNADEDQRQLLQAALHQSRINNGYCPNGCGLLRRITPHEAICEICKFQLFTHPISV